MSVIACGRGQRMCDQRLDSMAELLSDLARTQGSSSKHRSLRTSRGRPCNSRLCRNSPPPPPEHRTSSASSLSHRTPGALSDLQRRIAWSWRPKVCGNTLSEGQHPEGVKFASLLPAVWKGHPWGYCLEENQRMTQEQIT